ncbi:hypothetical protein HaLaN_20059 [Haematococcus lacustris]|uniref:Uncharacterized protein n=1 Tax=Haematococcus lacustris TaxID=44745 RepID=A0A699ZIL3_HAELA|nr:hypothetical protein HaLaN_20059 [Haematococcus lacustris]
MLSVLSVQCNSTEALNARRSTLSSTLPPTIKWRTRPAPPHRYEVEGVPEHPLAYLVEDEHLHLLPANPTNDEMHIEAGALILSVGGFTGDLCARLSLSWNATMMQLLGRRVDPDDVTKFDCTSNVTEPGYDAVLSWTMERSVADMLGEAMVHNTSVSNALLSGLVWGKFGSQVAAFQPSANNGTTPLLALVCSSEGKAASSTVHFVEVKAMCGNAWPSVAAVVTVATTGSGMFTSTAAGCAALDDAVAQYAEQALARSPAFPYTTPFPEPWQCNATETGLLGNYTLHPYIAQQFVTLLVADTLDAAALRQQLVLQVVAHTGFPRCGLNSFTIGSSRTGPNSTNSTAATLACPYNGEAFASLQAQVHHPPLSILYAAPELCCAAEGGLTQEWMPLSLLATNFEGTSAPADAGCNNATAAFCDQAYAMVVPERRLPLQMGCSLTGQGTAALAAAIDHACIRIFQERLSASASLQARVVQAALAALGPLRCTDSSLGGVISFSSAVDEFASSTEVPPSMTLVCSTAGLANTPQRMYAAEPQLCCPATGSPLQQHQPLFEAIYQKFLWHHEGNRRRST